MAREWDWQKANVVVLSFRESEGLFYVVDGQTRVAAAREAGLEQVQALVLFGLSVEREAELFASLNQERRRPSQLDVFKARLRAKDPVALKINEIVESHGYTIGRKGGAAHRRTYLIGAVNALERVYQAGGASHLDEVIRLLTDGFDHNAMGFTYWAIEGLSGFLRRYGLDCDKDRIVECLKKRGHLGMRQRTNLLRGGIEPVGSPGSAWGQVLLIDYNMNLRSRRLPDWADLRLRPKGGD